jgi:hypothetical protein
MWAAEISRLSTHCGTAEETVNREATEHVIAVAPRIPSICYTPQISLELD